MHGLRDVCFLPKSSALEDLALELEGGIIEVPGEAGVLHEAMEGGFEVVGGAEAREVDEVDDARARECEEREAED